MAVLEVVLVVLVVVVVVLVVVLVVLMEASRVVGVASHYFYQGSLHQDY